LLNVINPWVDDPVKPAATAAEALERLLWERQDYLDRQAATLQGLRLETRVEKRQRSEEADACIARVAREQRADLVVVASKRAASLQGFILGSVAQGLLRLSPCPVVVVRPE
jgi:nucleotide-binding universal stress UspA family protein